jgi:hypothetical protein
MVACWCRGLVRYCAMGLTCLVSSAWAAAPAVLISEYGEGSSYNKFVEIYNCSGTVQDLADFRLWLISNTTNNPGHDWPGSVIELSGTLATGDVYVVCHPSADPAVCTHADLKTSKLNHNGNDAVGLAWTNAGVGWVLIDAVGQAGENPGNGSGWAVAGTTEATLDHTLVRSAARPNKNWAESAGSDTNDSEWAVHASDTWAFLGNHTPPPEAPPSIGYDPPTTALSVRVYSELVFHVIGDDPNGDIVTLAPGVLPSGAMCPTNSGLPPVTNQFTWTPTAGGDHTVIFTAADNDGVTTSTVSIHVSAVLPSPERVWINEIHYDNDGTDTGEGVEVAGRAGLSLGEYKLLRYNGSTGGMYDDFVNFEGRSLGGAVGELGAAWVGLPSGGLQNDVDGVALVRVVGATTQVVQFISYEGSFAAADGPAKGFISEDIGVAESSSTAAGHSLQLTGSGTTYEDFTWAGPEPSTPDEVNHGQSYLPPPMVFIIR